MSPPISTKRLRTLWSSNALSNASVSLSSIESWHALRRKQGKPWQRLEFRQPSLIRCRDSCSHFPMIPTQRRKTGGVAARPPQASDEASADRVRDQHEHERHGLGCLLQRPGTATSSRPAHAETWYGPGSAAHHEQRGRRGRSKYKLN